MWLPFSQPDLWDVHSCSLLFVGALDEIQHFIWSLEWIEWGKFRCKAAIVFIFGPTILSCIKRGRVCYKSIWSYGDLDMFMGYVFIERVVGWRQWFLLWGTCQCLPTTYNSSGPNKINEYHCAWGIMLRTCLLVSKCVGPCTQDFQCDTFANSKVGCRCITDLFISINIGAFPVATNLCEVMSSLWFAQMRLMICYL